MDQPPTESNPFKNLSVSYTQQLDGSKTAHTESNYNVVLFAIGRSAHTEKLQLDLAGVSVNESGYIISDEWQNTNTDGVYALGDVCGSLKFSFLGSLRKITGFFLGATTD